MTRLVSRPHRYQEDTADSVAEFIVATIAFLALIVSIPVLMFLVGTPK